MAEHPLIEAFGAVLRSTRLEAHLSQEELAARANLDRTFVSMVERGTRKATLQTAKQLADALDIPLAVLIARAEQRLKS